MSNMIKYIAPYAGSIGLVIFFLFFIVAAFWAFRPANKARFNQYANIPLREDNDDSRR